MNERYDPSTLSGAKLEPRLTQALRDRAERFAQWARTESAKRAAAWSVLALGLILTAGWGLFAYQVKSFDPIVEARLRGGPFARTPLVLAAPKILRAGTKFSPDELISHLERSRYSTAGDSGSGRYELLDNAVRVVPGPRSKVAASAALVKFSGDEVAEIQGPDGAKIVAYEMEPEVLMGLPDAEGARRQILGSDEIPALLADALIAIEDRRFYSHGGFDFVRTTKAAIDGVVEWRRPRGTSTLTQQLARGFFLTPERTYSRKVNELLIARNLEQRLTKNEILAMYSNLVYLGRQGGDDIRGFGAGAVAFFGKDAARLELHEAAMLAGLVQRPSYLNPYTHPERAQSRRDTVLEAMLTVGSIDQAAYEAAVAKPLGIVETDFDAEYAPYFVDLIEQELDADQELAAALRDGGEIYTTLDSDLQALAVRVVREQMTKIDKAVAKQSRFRDQGAPQPQCALVVIDPRTGAIKALVGGREYDASPLNRALARRQPGSLMKPFVFAAAFSHGAKGGPPLTPISLLQDDDLSIEWEDGFYEPSNYGHKPEGFVTARRALYRSVNTATVRAARFAGYDFVAQIARSAGMGDPRATPSAALGAYEATPLEVAGAYTVFANGGVKVEPRLIEAVRPASKQSMIRRAPKQKPVLSAEVAYLVGNMMEDVMNRGTAAKARALGFRGPAAGKTGTDDDGWFAGFSDKLLCVVWVGFDDNRDLQLDGSESALLVWAELMKEASKLPDYRGAKPLARPKGVVERYVDPGLALTLPDDVSLPEKDLFVVDSNRTEVAIVKDPPSEEELLQIARNHERKLLDSAAALPADAPATGMAVLVGN